MRAIPARRRLRTEGRLYTAGRPGTDGHSRTPGRPGTGTHPCTPGRPGTDGLPRTPGRPGTGSRPAADGRPRTGSRRGPHPGLGPRGDRGQVAVEFLGMAPVILVTLVLLWQCVLLGYTYTLAGNAADEAVRAGAIAEGGQGACEQAGREDLPGAWQDGATISCGGRGSGYVTARVELKVPVLLPGLIGFPVPVKAHAGAVEEGKAD